MSSATMFRFPTVVQRRSLSSRWSHNHLSNVWLSTVVRGNKNAPSKKKRDGGGYWCLEYTYVSDILTKRTPYRVEHLALAQEYQRRKQLMYAGAWTTQRKDKQTVEKGEEQPDGGLFVFQQGVNKSIVEAFVAQDPYVRHALVMNYVLHDWHVVLKPREEGDEPSS